MSKAWGIAKRPGLFIKISVEGSKGILQGFLESKLGWAELRCRQSRCEFAIPDVAQAWISFVKD